MLETPPWLSWLWSSTGDLFEEEQGGGKNRILRLRSATKGNPDRTSPDVLAIHELIQKESDERVVMASWSEFVTSQPSLYRRDTIFPVTVFIQPDMYKQLRYRALAEVRRIGKCRADKIDEYPVSDGVAWIWKWGRHQKESNHDDE